ncbi:flagellar basal-body MS-ring/collar protein FliF [Pseudacidovorax intermedius]|uniref:flagellar basal-body MS-ring/collar protein FliF n=1 Tax=Pseudacidovorax intermedius TaxID=433924 RepID=UPI0003468973|nr:flagellar basal-body MS-ring/collar protein FliF [Pseudacidovorax intermedius]
MNFWDGLTRSARAGLLAGVLAIGLGLAFAAWWVFHTDYQVLFSDLKPQDAQAMTAELERLKIPYRLGDSGSAILVDKATVHATRIKLMGKELPLHGAVGLELFNNTDFGMTEFAQKINYQRALQGELTRTIQSLSEVREVRVLLALPEQGLFKQASSKAKASVTLMMRQGQELRPEQITGVQRLVAAAVPGLSIQDVTIVDGRGVALTRTDAGGGEGELNAARLDIKRDTEAYLSRKVGAILDRAFGAGQALASVDVTLNMDQIRTTTEDVLPAPSRNGLQSTGVVVREREVLRDGGGAGEARGIEAGLLRAGSSQRDVEYATGRRVEQVVSQPGSIRRIQVVAVVRTVLDLAQEEQLRRLIAAAVGASFERGDTVVVQTLAAPSSKTHGESAGTASSEAESAVPNVDGAGQGAVKDSSTSGDVESVRWLFALVLVIGCAAWVARAWTQRNKDTSSASRSRELTEAERAAALRRIREWLGESDSPGMKRPDPAPGANS